MQAWRDVLSAARRLTPAQHHAARLATVVHVQGSTYAQPGCRLLCADGEAVAGYVSGGCLERDLARRARLIDRPTVVTYDTRPGGEAEEFNLGCDGVIHLLVEPLSDALLEPLRAVVERREPRQQAIEFRGDVGARPDLAGEAMWQREATAMLRSGGGVIIEEDRAVFVERLLPMPKLVVLGAGHDAEPLARVGLAAGFEVDVIDPNPRRLLGEAAGRFPGAQTHCRDYGEWIAQTQAAGLFDPQVAAVLMTHDQSADALALPPLLASDVGYIGLLGPKRRTGKLMVDLHAAGTKVDAAALDKLHTPVGLDLGGGSPEEIAVAIVAEIIAARHARRGGFLQDRPAPIHDETAVVTVAAESAAP